MRKINIAVSQVLLGLVVMGAFHAEAQGLYRWEDKDGRVTYSDTPPPKEAKSSQKKSLVDNVIEQDSMSFSLKEAVRKNPVVLYTSECGEPCQQARALLSKRGIPFSERNVDKTTKRDKHLRTWLAD